MLRDIKSINEIRITVGRRCFEFERPDSYKDRFTSVGMRISSEIIKNMDFPYLRFQMSKIIKEPLSKIGGGKNFFFIKIGPSYFYHLTDEKAKSGLLFEEDCFEIFKEYIAKEIL